MERRSTPEQQPSSAEQHEAREPVEAPPKSHEKVDERREHEQQAENLAQAREEAQAESKLGSELESSTIEKQSAPAPHRGTQKKTLYRQTMRSTRAQLPRSSRAFSRLIHTRAVEATTETLSRTVLRPIPLLSAGIIGFVLSTLVYTIGRYYGYALVGGGWWLVSLAAGYGLGLIYDLTRLAWQRRQR